MQRTRALLTALAITSLSCAILPLAGCSSAPTESIALSELPTINSVRNKLTLTPRRDDRILWNDSPVTKEQLASLLAQSRKLAIEPELHFQPDMNASYELSASVLKIIKESGVTEFGFIGNEQFSEDERPKR